MSEAKDWPVRTRKVNALHLDFDNDRLAIEGRKTEKKIIKQLVDYHGVEEIAESIAEVGMFNFIYPICITRNGKQVVADGNRRLAALKLLLNPSLIENKKKQALFKRLSEKRDRKELEKIKVNIADDEEILAKIIYQIHTAENFKSWGPIQKAQFVAKLFYSSFSEKEIVKKYGITKNEIIEHLKVKNIYDYSLKTSHSLSKESQEIVRNPLKFKITNLTRFLNTVGGDFLGVDFNSEGRIVSKRPLQELESAFVTLLEQICSKEFNTRTNYEDYIRKNEKLKNNHRDLNVVIGEDRKQNQEKPLNLKSPVKIKQKVTSKYSGLIEIVDSCYHGTDSLVLNDLAKDLKTAISRMSANSTLILFRSFLEIGLYFYFEKSDRLKELYEYCKISKDGETNVSIKNMMSLLLKTLEKEKENKMMVRSINLFFSNNRYSHLASLNTAAHSGGYCFNFEDLRSTLETLKPVLKLIFSEKV